MVNNALKLICEAEYLANSFFIAFNNKQIEVDMDFTLPEILVGGTILGVWGVILVRHISQRRHQKTQEYKSGASEVLGPKDVSAPPLVNKSDSERKVIPFTPRQG